ncbi:hypothetical protein ACF0H5_007135 [Mactra antiquata]
MASDRVTKAALAAEKEFSKFLDDLNQYEFMKVYDNGDEIPPDDAQYGSTQMVLQPLGNYDLDDDLNSTGTSDSVVSWSVYIVTPSVIGCGTSDSVDYILFPKNQLWYMIEWLGY